MDDEERSAAASLLEHLDDRARRIVSLRFGLDSDGDPRSLQEVAALVGCSEQDVRAEETAALMAIRRRLHGDSA